MNKVVQIGLAVFGVSLLAAGCSSHSTSAQGPTQSPATSPDSSTVGGTSTSASVTPPASSTASSTPPASTAPTSSAPPTPVGPTGTAAPAGFEPLSATFISASTGWVLGTAPCKSAPCTSVVRTRDGGQSWQGIPAPRVALGERYDPKPGAVSMIRFADQSNGWAAAGSLYATHNGGASWHAVQVGPANSTVQSVETGGGQVFASVANCTRNSGSCTTTQVYAAAIGSDTWRSISPAYANRAVSRLTVYRGYWFLPTNSAIEAGHGTAAPAARPNPCPAEGGVRDVPSVAVADAQHLDAICTGDGAAGSAGYQVYGSTDGGQHWKASGTQHREASGLYGVADNDHGVLLAAVASGGSDILRTTNDGVTLNPAKISTVSGGVQWTELGFTTTTQAVAVLDLKALYFSHDAGATWTATKF